MPSEQLRADINSLLLERDARFPQRDEGNTQSLRAALDVYYRELRAAQSPAWRPDEELVARATSVQENIVVLCGAMKSGTTLMVELLDGSPQLIVMPGDSHLLAAVDAQGSPDGSDLGRYWIGRVVNPKGQQPFWLYGQQQAPYVAFLSWLGHWRRVLADTRQGPFLAAVLAHYCANPRRPSTPKGWVVKTPDNELHVERFLRLFPMARFVHVFRNPRDNLASLKRLYRTRGWPWSAVKQARRLADSLSAGLENRRRLGAQRYYCCRYEDLIRSPEASMRRLAGFLRIDAADELCVPTINGRFTKANSMVPSDQVVGQIRPNLSSTRTQVLSGAEQDALLASAGPMAARLGYEYGLGRVGLARLRHQTRLSGEYAQALWAALRARLPGPDRED